MKYFIYLLLLIFTKNVDAQLIPDSFGKFSRVELWDYSQYTDGIKIDDSASISKITISTQNGTTIVEIDAEIFKSDGKRLMPIQGILKEKKIADVILYQAKIDSYGTNANFIFASTHRKEEILEFTLWSIDEEGNAISKIIFDD